MGEVPIDNTRSMYDKLPPRGAVVRVRVKERRAYGAKPKSRYVDGVVLGRSDLGCLMRDMEGKVVKILASQFLDFTPFVPGQADGPLFDGAMMQDHIRQTGRPAVDMIGNPDPRGSNY